MEGRKMAKIDREKVVKGLECCSKSFNAMKCNSCPYDHYGVIEECTNVLAQDSLLMLKEHETEKERIKEIIWSVLHEGYTIDTIPDQDWVSTKILLLIDGNSEEHSNQL